MNTMKIKEQNEFEFTLENGEIGKLDKANILLFNMIAVMEEHKCDQIVCNYYGSESVVTIAQLEQIRLALNELKHAVKIVPMKPGKVVIK